MVCLAGTVTGWAGLELGFTDRAENRLAANLDNCDIESERAWVESAAFDAAALGIERIQVTIESPPEAGVGVQIVEATNNADVDTEDCVETASFT